MSESGKIDSTYTHVHDRSLVWLVTGTSIEVFWGKLTLIGPDIPSLATVTAARGE